jgi:hypothetical protein
MMVPNRPPIATPAEIRAATSSRSVAREEFDVREHLFQKRKHLLQKVEHQRQRSPKTKLLLNRFLLSSLTPFVVAMLFSGAGLKPLQTLYARNAEVDESRQVV